MSLTAAKIDTNVSENCRSNETDNFLRNFLAKFYTFKKAFCLQNILRKVPKASDVREKPCKLLS